MKKLFLMLFLLFISCSILSSDVKEKNENLQEVAIALSIPNDIKSQIEKAQKYIQIQLGNQNFKPVCHFFLTPSFTFEGDVKRIKQIFTKHWEIFKAKNPKLIFESTLLSNKGRLVFSLDDKSKNAVNSLLHSFNIELYENQIISYETAVTIGSFEPYIHVGVFDQNYYKRRINQRVRSRNKNKSNRLDAFLIKLVYPLFYKAIYNSNKSEFTLMHSTNNS